MKDDTCNICRRIHEITNLAKRYRFDTGLNSLPSNGIYIMFERGESAHGSDRIVRIGTHTGESKLPSRINQHFIKENKNRSIFRKNVGRCILNGHCYAEKWEINTSSRKARIELLPQLDLEFEKQIESQISNYIQSNLSFVIIPVNGKSKRLQLETQLITTIFQCRECKPSPEWLGSKSPLEKIRGSGLWQVQGMNGDILSDADLDFIEREILPNTR